jgi:hypothetical protein
MIRRANADTWCDYCKAKWGKNKDGTWHPKARTAASVTCYSIKFPDRQRSYCVTCIAEVSAWPDGSIFTLPEQLEFAKSYFAKAGFNVRIHEAEVLSNV